MCVCVLFFESATECVCLVLGVLVSIISLCIDAQNLFACVACLFCKSVLLQEQSHTYAYRDTPHLPSINMDVT
jgi:hypothetical protein